MLEFEELKDLFVFNAKYIIYKELEVDYRYRKYYKLYFDKKGVMTHSYFYKKGANELVIEYFYNTKGQIHLIDEYEVDTKRKIKSTAFKYNINDKLHMKSIRLFHLINEIIIEERVFNHYEYKDNQTLVTTNEFNINEPAKSNTYTNLYDQYNRVIEYKRMGSNSLNSYHSKFLFIKNKKNEYVYDINGNIIDELEIALIDPKRLKPSDLNYDKYGNWDECIRYNISNKKLYCTRSIEYYSEVTEFSNPQNSSSVHRPKNKIDPEVKVKIYSTEFKIFHEYNTLLLSYIGNIESKSPYCHYSEEDKIFFQNRLKKRLREHYWIPEFMDLIKDFYIELHREVSEFKYENELFLQPNQNSHQ